MARMQKRNRWLSLLISMTMLIPVMLYAASEVDGNGLFNFTPNTVISSKEVNDNFDVLGNFMTTYEDAITVDGNGNVGVGTTSPKYTADVNGQVQVRDNVWITSTGSNNHSSVLFTPVGSGQARLDSAQNGFSFLNKGVPALVIDSTGTVGIGTSTPTKKLDVIGYIRAMIQAQGDSSGISLGASHSEAPQITFHASDSSERYVIKANLQQNTHSDTLSVDTARAPGALAVTGDGRVGIGTMSPGAALTVTKASNGWDNGVRLLDQDGTNEWNLHSDTNGYFMIGRSGLDAFRIGSTGNIGISTTTPTYRLDVNGTIRGYGITDASSRQYKDHIRTLEADDALKALTALRPTRYHYKQDNTEERLGFIAEEVPELLSMKDRQGVSSMDVVAVLTKVVQVQQTQLEEQRKQLETLRKEMHALSKASGK